MLDLLKQQFDFVVVDTPPAFDDHVLAAFDQSDMVALLATLDIPALKNLKLTLETLDLLNYPRERWRLVLNRADSKVGLALSEVEKTLKAPISVQIPSSRDVPASINRGVPIVLDDPKHPVSPGDQGASPRTTSPPARRLGEHDIPTGLRADRRGLLRRKTQDMSLADRLAAAQRERGVDGPEAAAGDGFTSAAPRAPTAAPTRSPTSSARCTRRCSTTSAPSSTTRG